MLTDQEKAILDLEERMPVHSSHKGDVIRAEVGLSVARYYQALHVLAGSRDALEVAPAVCKRVLSRIDKLKARRRAS